MKSNEKRTFKDLEKSEQANIVTNILYIVSHLNLAIEAVDEIENTVVWKHRLKLTAKNFVAEAEKVMNEVLCAFDDDEVFRDDEGKIIGGKSVDIQEQAFLIINKIKELNKLAIVELKEVLYDEESGEQGKNAV